MLVWLSFYYLAYSHSAPALIDRYRQPDSACFAKMGFLGWLLPYFRIAIRNQSTNLWRCHLETRQDRKTEGRVEEQPEELPPLTTTTERRLMAKVDWHVVPCLCVLYLLAFIDR